MKTSIATSTDGSLLPAIRSVLKEAEEAMLCVAFVSEKGVYLLKKELESLQDNAKILVTTTFGTTSIAALNMLQGFGNQVGYLNPSGGTYHPKMYISKHKNEHMKAVIGSSNLTGGLISNIELASVLSGTVHDQPLQKGWDWGEKLWAQRLTIEDALSGSACVFEPQLLATLKKLVADNPVFMTLGPSPKVNRVTNVTPYGLYIETERSIKQGSAPQLVEAWMLELAWDYLRFHRTISNSYLLNELRVHRSSAVCAILARLPMVEQLPGRPITLRWNA